MTVSLLKVAVLFVATAAVLCRFLLSWGRYGQVMTANLEAGQGAASLSLSLRRPFADARLGGRVPAADRRIVVKGLTKAEAEDLLDWLEVHGQSGQVSYVEGEGFAVR